MCYRRLRMNGRSCRKSGSGGERCWGRSNGWPSGMQSASRDSGHGLLGGECAVSWEFFVVQYIPRELASSISALAFTKNKTLCGAFNLVEAPKLKATEVRSVKPCRIIKEFPFTNQFIERTMFDSDLGLAFCF